MAGRLIDSWSLNFRLDVDEGVVKPEKPGPFGLPTPKGWVTARVALTDVELRFEPDGLNSPEVVAHYANKSLLLEEIASIEHKTLALLDVVLVAIGNSVYRFRLPNALGFSAALQAAQRARKNIVTSGESGEPPAVAVTPEVATVPLASVAGTSLIACGTCGHPISAQALACPVCKTAPGNVTPAALPVAHAISAGSKPLSFADAAVRDRLSQFQQRTKFTCMDCGYVGESGVVKEFIPGYASWPFFIGVLVVVAVVFGTWGLAANVVLGFVLFFIRQAASTTIVQCAGCGVEKSKPGTAMG